MVNLLLLLSAVCFLLAAANAPLPRVNLVALGLLLWVLSILVPGLPLR